MQFLQQLFAVTNEKASGARSSFHQTLITPSAIGSHRPIAVDQSNTALTVSHTAQRSASARYNLAEPNKINPRRKRCQLISRIAGHRPPLPPRDKLAQIARAWLWRSFNSCFRCFSPRLATTGKLSLWGRKKNKKKRKAFRNNQDDPAPHTKEHRLEHVGQISPGVNWVTSYYRRACNLTDRFIHHRVHPSVASLKIPGRDTRVYFVVNFLPSNIFI